MYSIRYIAYSLFLLSTVLLIPTSSQAVVLFEKLDRHLVKYADAVVVGVVTDTFHRTATSSVEYVPPIPHTFVAIEIEQTLKGSIASSDIPIDDIIPPIDDPPIDDPILPGDGNILNQEEEPSIVILRFEGGMASDGETFMYKPGVPLFDVGDRGLFFIRNNGESVAPLIGWRQGFIRILENGELIMNDIGAELHYNEKPDPLVAPISGPWLSNVVGFHPMDIWSPMYLDSETKPEVGVYTDFIARLTSEDNLVVSTVYDNLSNLAKQLIEEAPWVFDTEDRKSFQLEEFPSTIPQEMRETFTGNNPFLAPSLESLDVPDGTEFIDSPDGTTIDNPTGEIMDWPTPDNFLHAIYPDHFRAQARDIFQAILTRDLNILLMRKDLFTVEMINSLEFQPRNEALVYSDVDTLSLTQIALRNRRIMEAAFPNTLVASLDSCMIRGEFNPHPSYLTTDIMGNTLEIYSPEEEAGEGPTPSPPPLPESSQPMNIDSLIGHFNQMVEGILTTRDYELLEPVPSLNPDAQPINTYQFPEMVYRPLPVPAAPEPTSKEGQTLLENNGNPVFQ